MELTIKDDTNTKTLVTATFDLNTGASAISVDPNFTPTEHELNALSQQLKKIFSLYWKNAPKIPDIEPQDTVLTEEDLNP